MLVVADTSPLNYLVWVEAIEILPRMYGNVSIPAEVRSELLAPETPPKVREWALALPSWIAVQAPCLSLPDDPQFRSLDPGERAALALAASQPSLLLIDERAGTAVARNLGLRTTGTLGVLDEAARRGLISLPDVIGRLEQTSFRYPKVLVRRLLAEDSRRRPLR